MPHTSTTKRGRRGGLVVDAGMTRKETHASEPFVLGCQRYRQNATFISLYNGSLRMRATNGMYVSTCVYVCVCMCVCVCVCVCV